MLPPFDNLVIFVNCWGYCLLYCESAYLFFVMFGRIICWCFELFFLSKLFLFFLLFKQIKINKKIAKLNACSVSRVKPPLL